MQFQRQQTGSQTYQWKPQVLTLGDLNLVKWNSHFYFSILKALYLIAQLKGQFLQLMGEHRSHPRVETDFLGNPRAPRTHCLFWGQRESCWKAESSAGTILSHDLPGEDTFRDCLSISASVGIYLEPPGHRNLAGSWQGVTWWKLLARSSSLNVFQVLLEDSIWIVLVTWASVPPDRPWGSPLTFLVTLFKKHMSTGNRLSSTALLSSPSCFWDVS